MGSIFVMFIAERIPFTRQSLTVALSILFFITVVAAGTFAPCCCLVGFNQPSIHGICLSVFLCTIRRVDFVYTSLFDVVAVVVVVVGSLLFRVGR